MKTITLGFSKPKGFKVFSFLIRKFEDTPYSHSYVIINSEYIERRYVFQASGTTVNYESLDNFLAHADPISEFEFEIDEEKYKEILRYCIDNANKSYSLRSIVQIVWKRLFGSRLLRGDNNAKFICSELAYEVLKRITDVPAVNPDLVTPKELYEICVDLKRT